ncbi:MAG: SpoIIE family protein phosphatase, partial [Crocinitomicaceae bacterium]|nr:SpoIIE family protein phosphatase [Crocinitomicaceae bacterium]
YENGLWRKFYDENNIHKSIILDIEEDKDFNILVSTHGYGIRKFLRTHPDSSTFYGSIIYYSNIVPSGLTYDILIDQDSTMVLADYNAGIVKVKHDSVYWFREDSNLPSISMHSSAQTENGDLWVASANHGISLIRNNQIKQITTREGLLSNNTRWPYADSQGNVWITYSTPGLTKIIHGNEDSMIHFLPEDGLFTGKINSISEDNFGTLWLATNKGIVNMFQSGSGTNQYQSICYTTSDGLKALDYMAHSGTIDSNNVIWFGTRQGMTCVDLDYLYEDPGEIQLELVSLQINDAFYSLSDTSNAHKYESDKFKMDGVLPFTNVPENLELDYFQNNLTFEFSAVHWGKPGRLKFRHRLFGYSEEWSKFSDEATVTYSNLKPGEYTLDFRAEFENEDWYSQRRFTFYIHPPWWQTWWFRTLAAAFIILVLIQIFRWRTAQLRKRQLELEETVKERTAEIEHQKTVIEEKQKETMDSINYAKRIQYTLLAHDDLMIENLPDHFVFFKPKDVVSGDFYWATRKLPDDKDKRDLFFLAVCDSTGHGVPGAFMSLLNISFLNEAINEKRIFEPGKILDHTRLRLIENISKEGHQDGMDGILVCFDKSSQTIFYAAGHNNPVLVTKDGLTSLPADKMPIGKSDKEQPFTTHQIQFTAGDMLFLPTDGYSDQFGGTGLKPAGKKFKRSNLNQLFEKISVEKIPDQQIILETTLADWKGEFEQVDDITIIGIKLRS